MELISGSETSATRTLTPGNYPKRNKLHLEHGESLKTTTGASLCVLSCRCQQCGTESAQPSLFYELELNIAGHKTIADCLEEFLKEEKLEGADRYHCTV